MWDTSLVEDVVAGYQAGLSLDEISAAHNFATEDEALAIIDWAASVARDWASLARRTTGWPADELGALELYYGKHQLVGGKPSTLWEINNLVKHEPPWQMVLSWQPGTKISGFQIHKKCAPSIDRVMRKIWEAYGEDQRAIELERLHLFGGCYNYRKKRGSSSLSLHAWGAAIDLDPYANPLGRPWDPVVGLPMTAVEAFESEGWT